MKILIETTEGWMDGEGVIDYILRCVAEPHIKTVITCLPNEDEKPEVVRSQED